MHVQKFHSREVLVANPYNHNRQGTVACLDQLALGRLYFCFILDIASRQYQQNGVRLLAFFVRLVLTQQEQQKCQHTLSKQTLRPRSRRTHLLVLCVTGSRLDHLGKFRRVTHDERSIEHSLIGCKDALDSLYLGLIATLEAVSSDTVVFSAETPHRKHLVRVVFSQNGSDSKDCLLVVVPLSQFRRLEVMGSTWLVWITIGSSKVDGDCQTHFTTASQVVDIVWSRLVQVHGRQCHFGDRRLVVHTFRSPCTLCAWCWRGCSGRTHGTVRARSSRRNGPFRSRIVILGA
mmetsp:Transcript_7657/g.17596  ORF Transcript_7657/g.17596 Transcript_7657/m.17596 type:complete len:290 (-) Transcript_7657:940-1809(-)